MADLEELETAASEDETLAEAAAAKAKTEVAAFERRRPARKLSSEHLPRERVVIAAPCSCAACGSDRIAKMYTLIVTAKLNGVDLQAWLANVIANIASTPMSCLEQLLPWNWVAQRQVVKAA